MNKIEIFVGLGNPGAAYEHTYHNVGTLALEKIFASRLADGEAPNWKSYKKLFLYAASPTAVFVKPLTFMNESGVAVSAALKKFGASPANLVVLHDESDLPIGNFKISTARNAAGHNGVQSIIDHLGTNAFTRIRIGIRPADEATRKKASDFVLKRITKKGEVILESVFEKIIREAIL